MVEVDTITLAEISVTHSRWQLNTTGRSGATKLDNRTQVVLESNSCFSHKVVIPRTLLMHIS